MDRDSRSVTWSQHEVSETCILSYGQQGKAPLAAIRSQSYGEMTLLPALIYWQFHHEFMVSIINFKTSSTQHDFHLVYYRQTIKQGSLFFWLSSHSQHNTQSSWRNQDFSPQLFLGTYFSNCLTVIKENLWPERSPFVHKAKVEASKQLFTNQWVMLWLVWFNMYSQVHKYWDIDTILIFLALYTTTMILK